MRYENKIQLDIDSTKSVSSIDSLNDQYGQLPDLLQALNNNQDYRRVFNLCVQNLPNDVWEMRVMPNANLISINILSEVEEGKKYKIEKTIADNEICNNDIQINVNFIKSITAYNQVLITKPLDVPEFSTVSPAEKLNAEGYFSSYLKLIETSIPEFYGHRSARLIGNCVMLTYEAKDLPVEANNKLETRLSKFPMAILLVEGDGLQFTEKQKIELISHCLPNGLLLGDIRFNSKSVKIDFILEPPKNQLTQSIRDRLVRLHSDLEKSLSTTVELSVNTASEDLKKLFLGSNAITLMRSIIPVVKQGSLYLGMEEVLQVAENITAFIKPSRIISKDYNYCAASEILDLTKVRTIAIDARGTVLKEDALSIETLSDGEKVLGIHIINPLHIAPFHSRLYEEIKKCEIYDIRSPETHNLAPLELKQITGFSKDNEQEAFSLLVSFDAKGKFCNYRIVRSLIKIDEDYIKEFINEHQDNKELSDISSCLTELSSKFPAIKRAKTNKDLVAQSLDFYNLVVQDLLIKNNYAIPAYHINYSSKSSRIALSNKVKSINNYDLPFQDYDLQDFKKSLFLLGRTMDREDFLKLVRSTSRKPLYMAIHSEEANNGFYIRPNEIGICQGSAFNAPFRRISSLLALEQLHSYLEGYPGMSLERIKHQLQGTHQSSFHTKKILVLLACAKKFMNGEFLTTVGAEENGKLTGTSIFKGHIIDCVFEMNSVESANELKYRKSISVKTAGVDLAAMKLIVRPIEQEQR